MVAGVSSAETAPRSSSSMEPRCDACGGRSSTPAPRRPRAGDRRLRGAQGRGERAGHHHQAIKETFAQHPAGLRTAHFDAQRGLDVFGNVRAIVVVGRPLPQVLELRDMALALTGRAVPVEDGRQETRGVLMADGTGAGK